MSARRLSLVIGILLLLPLLLPRIASAATLSIPVNCDGTLIGNVTVNTFIGPGGAIGGVNASFTSVVGVPPSLSAAAALCGEDHFNWYQVVAGDNHPPKDAHGNPLTPPYVDPPPGGYSADPTQNPPFPVLWADNLPWFYNEGPPPPAGTPGYDPANNLSAHAIGDTLDFTDLPNGPLGTNLLFRTWLVSLNADGSFNEFHVGFTWNWIRDLNGVVTVSQLGVITTDPPASQYQDIITGFDTRIVPLPLAAFPGMIALGGLILSRVRVRKASKEMPACAPVA
jgi:hypothetical protein